MTPQTFGRFTIIRKLPAGGMGRVYEATETMTGRRVALKLIDRGTDSDSMQIVAAERLGVELHKRLFALDPRITAVYDSGETPDNLFIVMEYIDGEDLSELAAKQRIGYPFAARIAQDVLEVLSHAHNFATVINGREYRGIVHGDIKPRNIRLTTVGQVKVLDFGIAKALSTTRRFTQNLFGSVQYSSPERLMSGEVTISSDLWAVAVVLYEMVARHPYFEAQSPERLNAIIRGYREVQPLPDECPEPLKQILQRSLDPHPAIRYQSAGEFAADLAQFRAGGTITLPADIEATRRTYREANGGDDSETRRTFAGVGVETGPQSQPDMTARSNGNPPIILPPAPPKPVTPPKKTTGIRWNRVALIAFALVVAFVGYLIYSEFETWSEARALARDLQSERVQKLDTAWDQYQKFVSHSNLSWSTWALQDALRDRLLADAEHVILDYRKSEMQVINEADWMRARAGAARALQLKPGDKTARGTLRLIDGHLARIRGTYRRDAKLLQESRQNFEEAAQLLPKSPDPWLGLARLYVYSLHDVDKAAAALKEAEKRGQEIGKRETAQLADGFRDRADRTFREAQLNLHSPEVQRYLELAKKDYERARELYESIIPWGGAAQNLHKTYDGLERVEHVKATLEQEHH